MKHPWLDEEEYPRGQIQPAFEIDLHGALVCNNEDITLEYEYTERDGWKVLGVTHQLDLFRGGRG